MLLQCFKAGERVATCFTLVPKVVLVSIISFNMIVLVRDDLTKTSIVNTPKQNKS